MKTRTKKCGVFVALAAALLVTVALVTSCIDPVSPGGLTIKYGQIPNEFVPPFPASERATDLESPDAVDADVEDVVEKGYLRLNIVSDESNARTILPSGSPMSSIVEYEVLHRVGNGGASSSGRIDAGDIGTPISINVGTYNIEVRGYADPDSPVVVAVGTASGIVIVAENPDPGENEATINFNEVYDTTEGTGTGTFAWNFTFPGTPDVVGAATLNVTAWSGSPSIPSTATNVTLNTATATGSVDLLSGYYYYVDVKLTKANCLPQTYREILHVANGMTSTWTKTDFRPLGSNVYTVTYFEATGPASSSNPVTGVAHGSTIALAPSDPVGYSTDAWYRTRTGSADPYTYTNPWTFGAAGTGTMVIGNITLYPKWVGGVSSGTLTITIGSFALSDGDDKTFTFSGTGVSNGNEVTYTHENLYATGSHVVNVTLAVGTFTAVRATYMDDATLRTFTVSGGSDPSTDPFIIEINLDAYTNLKVATDHIITIYGTVGGTEYSAELILKVTDTP